MRSYPYLNCFISAVCSIAFVGIWEVFAQGVEIEWVFVESGTFKMGDTFGDGDCNEKPVHTVTVSDFYISKYEITFSQYDSFCDATGKGKPNDEGWGRGNQPVINVSWYDAKKFCDWMSKQTGRLIRLPTEAEWEYATRGGNQSRRYEYSGSSTVDKVGWYGGNSDHRTHPTGQKKSNEVGIYDMSGNVWEWCSDWYDEEYYGKSPERNPQGPSSGNHRVLRGGSWRGATKYLRCTGRGGDNPVNRLDHFGFRCVMSE